MTNTIIKPWQNSTTTVVFALSIPNTGVIRINSIAGIATVHKKPTDGSFLPYFTVEEGEQKKEINCSEGFYEIRTTGNFNFEVIT